MFFYSCECRLLMLHYERTPIILLPLPSVQSIPEFFSFQSIRLISPTFPNHFQSSDVALPISFSNFDTPYSAVDVFSYCVKKILESDCLRLYPSLLFYNNHLLAAGHHFYVQLCHCTLFSRSLLAPVSQHHCQKPVSQSGRYFHRYLVVYCDDFWISNVCCGA